MKTMLSKKCNEFIEKNGVISQDAIHDIIGEITQEFINKLCRAVIPDAEDIPMFAAAHFLIGKSLCDLMSEEEKLIYEKILKNANTTSTVISGDRNEGS